MIKCALKPTILITVLKITLLELETLAQAKTFTH